MKSYRQSRPFQRLVRRSAASRPMAKLYRLIQPPVDRFVYRLTGGRATLSSSLSGIEVSMLTTTGARTGSPRTLPVLALPDGQDLILIASNFGRPRHPSWYHNLRVNPEATIVTGGVTRVFTARELSGSERERWYARAEEIFPPFTAYPRWAGDREIPVLRLQASGGAPSRARPGAIGLLVLVLASLAAAVAAAPAGAIVPLGQFGAGPGDQAGLLGVPGGVGVDPSGRVYVAEGERISVFSPQGPFLRAFGKDVAPDNGRTRFEQCTTNCKAGEPGGDTGELHGAAGLAVDAGGVVYVAEEDNHRISVFDQLGGFVRSFGKDVDPNEDGAGLEVCTALERCKPGEPGSGAGELFGPLGLALDSTGRLLVAESGNSRVSLYTREGAFLGAFGTFGERAGELSGPFGVAVDRAGNVYVSELHNRRVSVFSPELAFLRAFGTDVIPSNDVAGFEVCTAATGCKAGTNGAIFRRPGTGGPQLNGAGVLNRPVGVAIAPNGRVMVTESDTHRVSVFSAASAFRFAFGKDVVPDNGATGFEECRQTCKAAGTGAGPGELNLPGLMAVDCRGALYVAELLNGRVQRFGAPGTDTPPCGRPAALGQPFGIMKVGRHPRRGSATLTISVPWSAQLRLRGRGIRPLTRQVEFAGRTRLTVRPTRATMRRLRARGQTRVRTKVTYWPWGGTPRTKTRAITLRKTSPIAASVR